jgi:hypothetical protein
MMEKGGILIILNTVKFYLETINLFSRQERDVKKRSCSCSRNAVEASVKRVYTVTGDSLNPVNDAVRRDGRLQWIHVRHLEDYLRAKQNGDNHLKASALNYSIVRPGSLTDKDSIGKIELKEKLDKRRSISRADVAKTLVAVLDDGVKKNQVFEILDGETSIEIAIYS